jgi:hypothetical protein
MSVFAIRCLLGEFELNLWVSWGNLRSRDRFDFFVQRNIGGTRRLPKDGPRSSNECHLPTHHARLPMAHDVFLVIVGFVVGTLMTCLIMEVYMRRRG